MKISRRSVLASTAALPVAVSLGAKAKAQAVNADDLKSTLMPLGGIRAGNAEGTIPAWTGELIPLPADYKSGQVRPDPFANDAVVVTITAANMAQYQDKLTQGDIHLLQTFPDYQIEVYPTHRTAIAPQYIYDYTYKNVSTAQLSPDGNNLTGAYGGIPFPIPTNGKQILWNHLVRWLGTTITNPSGDYQVTSSGEIILRAFANLQYQMPYYFNGREAEFNGIYEQLTVQNTAPAYVEGQSVLVLNPINPVENPSRGWEYLLGERRVRLAPQLVYDTPEDTAGGILQWDEAAMFNGATDQYDCKIIGKKEMYVPYNCNKAWATPIVDVLGPKHTKPGVMRFELHRVWVVEMTLAPGKRNVDARRTIYVDEDTWLILAIDIYDANNSLWKYHYAVPALCSDVPAMCSGFYLIAYDFHSGTYLAFGAFDVARSQLQWGVIPELPPSYFTPGELAALAGGS